MEVVDAAFELLDELQARAHAGQLRVELGGELAETRRGLGAVFDRLHLAEHRVHLRLELGRAAEERGGAFAERFERRAIGAQLVAQLRRGGMRLVELGDISAQRFEILARLLQRVVLGLRAAAHLVHLGEPLAERFERALLASHFVGLRHQRLERLAELVGALVHHRELLVLLQHAVHARFGFRHVARQPAQAVIELIEFLLVDAEALDGGLQVVREPAAFLVEARELTAEFLAHGRGRRQLRGGLLRQFLHPRHGVFGARHVLAAFVELGNLHVHRPHHLVEAVGLDHGAFDGVLLGLEGLGLLRDVFGEGVQRREALLGVLAELLQLHQRSELLLDLLDRFHRRRGIVLRFCRRLPKAPELRAQLRARGADGIELALQRGHAFDRLCHFGGRQLQQRAQIFKRGAFLAKGLDGGLVFERL